MLIAIPKKVTELEDKIRTILKGEIWSFCYERGVRFEFVDDSSCINDCIESISHRVAYLILNTKLDNNVLEMYRKEGEHGIKQEGIDKIPEEDEGNRGKKADSKRKETGKGHSKAKR